MANIINKIKEFENKEYEFSKKEKIEIMLFLIVCSGIFGFIYEMLFYRIDLGYFVKRGTTYGPWIPIYGFGGLFIILVSYRFRKKPLLVFLLSALVSGLLEFGTGYAIFHILNLRLWDYNTEIWNWGNIGGYICFRSVMFFAVSGLLLTYVFVPIAKLIASKMNKKVFSVISIVPAILFLFDMIFSNFIK